MKGRQPSMLADRVAQRLRDLGEQQAYLVHRAGVRRDYVSDLLTGRKQTISPRELARFAAALRCSELFLLGDVDEPSQGAHRRPMRLVPPFPAYLRFPNRASDPPEMDERERDAAREEAQHQAALDSLDPWPDLPEPEASLNGLELRMRFSRPLVPVERRRGRPPRTPLIPLYTMQPGRPARIEPGTHETTTPLPDRLARAPGAYAVVWQDDHLDPRIRCGETFYAAPGLGPRLGDDVLIITKVSAGSNLAIGRLLEARRSRCRIAPFDTGAPCEIATDTIRVIHRIVMIVAAGV